MAERKLEDRFQENVSRYPFYFVTVLLGGVWALVKPWFNLYGKNKASAIAALAGLVGLAAFVSITLYAMTTGPSAAL
ncbi:MAG: DUF751 family protein [Cyanobacteria bacterium J06639_1]